MTTLAGALGSAGLRDALPRPARSSVRALLATIALAGFCSLCIAAGGALVRLGLALAIAVLLATIVLIRPAAGVIATLVYLVLEELLRRILIPVSPWVSFDPLLLVGPVVALVLLVKLFVLESRRWARDVTSKLVLLVLLITLAEVANPAAAGGIRSGLTGLVFMAVPLLWFFIGREVLSDRDVDRLLAAVVGLGTIVACYGLWQTAIGDPPWDLNWLNVASGYTSLHVGDVVRPFGTFASSSEYALFLGVALVVCVSFALRGQLIALVPTPLLAVALFLSSARGALVTAAVAIVVLIGLRTGRPATALAVVVLATGAAFLGVRFAGSSLSGSSSNALVSHEVSGIADPLNPNSSTLVLHVQLMVDGFKSSLHHPLGEGTAVTNGAAGTIANSVNQNPQATEVDISNAFVALGIGGGVVYLALVVAVLATGAITVFTEQAVLLGALAVLLVDLGQWGIGGDYALAPLAWLMAGAVVARGRGGGLKAVRRR
ncbi:MAG: hypothetical protein ACRDL5_11050 [Solirubrobacteraceae bacterium]